MDLDKGIKITHVLLAICFILAAPFFFCQGERGLIFYAIGIVLCAALLGAIIISSIVLIKDLKGQTKKERINYFIIFCAAVVLGFLMVELLTLFIAGLATIAIAVIGSFLVILLRRKLPDGQGAS